jgi:hypothetical protein
LCRLKLRVSENQIKSKPESDASSGGGRWLKLLANILKVLHEVMSMNMYNEMIYAKIQLNKHNNEGHHARYL